MDNTVQNTEELILDAAKSVFIQKGMYGARMQEIADKAGINKSLLHYYYRDKEKLFFAVFKDIVKDFFPKIESIIISEDNIEHKIQLFVEYYTDLLIKNPFIPLFILQEINRNPDKLTQVFFDAGIKPQIIIEQIRKTQNSHFKEKLDPDPRHIIVNMISMLVFPIAGRPILQRVLFNNDEVEYNQFLTERKKLLSSIIIKALKYE